MNFEVNENNKQECLRVYAIHKEFEKYKNYTEEESKEFIDWCENNLIKCPCCGDILDKNEQQWLNEPKNTDNVCDYCIEENNYYG